MPAGSRIDEKSPSEELCTLLEAYRNKHRDAPTHDELAGLVGRIKDLETEAARYRYIEDHATTVGGGNGFLIECLVPVDHEDMGCAIDAAIIKIGGHKVD